MFDGDKNRILKISKYRGVGCLRIVIEALGEIKDADLLMWIQNTFLPKIASWTIAYSTFLCFGIRNYFASMAGLVASWSRKRIAETRSNKKKTWILLSLLAAFLRLSF
jgi:hypothetical protein